MPEKGLNWLSQLSTSAWTLKSNPLHQWRFAMLIALVFGSLVTLWSIDGCTIKGFLDAWRINDRCITIKVNSRASPTVTNGFRNFEHSFTNLSHGFSDSIQGQQNLSRSIEDFVSHGNLTRSPTDVSNYSVMPERQKHSVKSPAGVALIETNVQAKSNSDWISAEFKRNFTSSLLARWLAPGGETCRESRTVEIRIPGLDGRNSVKLSAGEVHEFSFQALDENRKSVCVGGDYFETDLSGEAWKSRPVVKDFGNGTYSMLFQVHQDFTGEYNLTVNLLFRHYEGLRYSPPRFAYNKELRKIPLKILKFTTKLPELKTCQKSDFGRGFWVGRWTRHGKNDKCEISNDGRYRCLPSDFPCKSPWCHGSLGTLESNGWVYSAHCSFRLFTAHTAWNCLKNRWIFFWGDSNHVDTIRNMLNFVLDLPHIAAVPRRFDMNFSNPRDPSQSVRITSLFNGHWNETGNYLGLDSLQNEGFRNLVKNHFSGNTVPDTIIMNSGLHDGVHWHHLRAFSGGAEYAANFWKEVLESIMQRGLEVPKVIYRNTVATGGYARTLGFNPSKMETYNAVLIDRLKQAGILSGVIDNFDLTFPWHFDNRCNDGVHYGRAPLKRKWRDGQIGHQYFVDLMLAHVLLNALCTR